MKFPRNARVFRGQLDVAPFASVLFLLVIFVLLFTLPGTMLYTPGVPVRIQPPEADHLPGVAGPTLTVGLDAAGRIYFENQIIGEEALKTRLLDAAKKSPEPLTLIVQADKSAAYNHLLNLTLMARDAGITDTLLATLPRAFSPPDAP